MTNQSNVKDAQIDEVLESMLLKNEKINISQVAKKIGVSHSAIYNIHPNKIHDIKTAQEKQRNTKKSIDLGIKNELLKKQVKESKDKNKLIDELVQSLKDQNQNLWMHIQQIYSMYDEVLAERNAFAERIKSHEIR